MLTPTLYRLLMDRAANGPNLVLRDELESQARAAVDVLQPRILDGLREAYAAGVADGFAQGVAAAAGELEDKP